MKRVLLFILACCFAVSLAGCAVGADAGMDGVSVSAGPDGSMDMNGNNGNLDRDLADDGIVNNNNRATNRADNWTDDNNNVTNNNGNVNNNGKIVHDYNTNNDISIDRDTNPTATDRDSNVAEDRDRNAGTNGVVS